GFGAGFAVNGGRRGKDERLDPAIDRRLDQSACVRNVVKVVAERIADGVRYDNLGGEMGDRVDRMLLDQAPDQLRVARVAGDELGPFGDAPGEARGKIVENDDGLAGIEEAERHMATDIAGAAGHQNAHYPAPFGLTQQ